MVEEFLEKSFVGGLGEKVFAELLRFDGLVGRKVETEARLDGKKVLVEAPGYKSLLEVFGEKVLAGITGEVVLGETPSVKFLIEASGDAFTKKLLFIDLDEDPIKNSCGEKALRVASDSLLDDRENSMSKTSGEKDLEDVLCLNLLDGNDSAA